MQILDQQLMENFVRFTIDDLFKLIYLTSTNQHQSETTLSLIEDSLKAYIDAKQVHSTAEGLIDLATGVFNLGRKRLNNLFKKII